MGLSRVRSGAGKERKETDSIALKEPLVDRSRFTYELTERQLEIIIETGAKTEIRKIAETGKKKQHRIEAVKALVELEDKDSIPILEEIVRTDPEKEVRNEAGNAILKLKGESREFVEKQGIETLDISEIIDDAIEFAETDIPEDDYPDFEIEDPEAEKRLQEYAKKAALEKLRKGDSGNLYMVIELAFIEENTILQKKAIEALIDFEDREALNIAKMVVGNGEDNKPLLEKIEIKLLELSVKEFQAGDESRLPEVAQMLFKNKDYTIKQMAFEALIMTKNPGGMDAVRLYLTEDENRPDNKEISFKRYMLREMDGIRHPKFLDTFIEVLRFTSDQRVMDILISSLFMYGSKKSIDVLDYTANRKDIDEETRKGAITALSLLGGW